ncbi:hypothetical protein BJ322DRAFT_1211109 [Thelephora terrestris]|uniref:Nephrocystin 3-like N-terminal domain-containing protein n=1 Tax=Thelephora terrestris TaxID=56493 RepID=A0A9P6HDV2_9AGAM|nr:hypothetical protein BJ322DRAFT_1211109 [Thelephora terrestris]
MPDSQSKRRRAGFGAGGSSRTRGRVIDAATTFLDIAKESADAFPPLKSCLNAIDAFRKHYEETKDVEEKLGALIPWLNRLDIIVKATGPDVNLEEKERREQLERSLENILKQAQVLSEKGVWDRFLDKKQDSGAIVKFAEELQHAILIYQLSQQQSIGTQLCQLATSFEAFLRIHKGVPGVKEKIQSTLSWLGRLKVEGSAVGDEGKPEQRKILFEAIEGIEVRLQSLSQSFSATGSQENHKYMEAICGLAGDARDAIIEYQFHQQKVLYDQNCELIDKTEWLVLNTCPRAHGAGYQHGLRSGCLKGTRESVLDKVEQWSDDFKQSPIFWLHGLAGTGKTTIAQTIAERLFADDIAYHPLQDQIAKFIVEPLWSTGIATTIVIDALDECQDEGLESTILPLLGKYVQGIPKLKIFITSRPETHITTGFHGPLQDLTDVFILHEVEAHTINQDIRRFFMSELSKLAQHHGGKQGWPTDEQLDWLCRRAAGFFIHAVATVNVLSRRLDVPWGQLDTLMESPESTSCEGEAKLKVYNTLDTLYLSILHTSFQDNKAEDDNIIRSILSCVVLATNPLSPSTIATLMGLGYHRVRLVLELTRSLLVLSLDPNEPVQPFHKSFPDFITDWKRCTDNRFYISPDCHIKIFLCCLETIGRALKDQPPLPDPGLIYKVTDLPKIETEGICSALRYACGSWHKHLVLMEDPTPEVLSTLFDFLDGKFIFWLAVLKALGDLPSGCRVMDTTTKWLKKPWPSTHGNALLDIAAHCSDLIGHLIVISNLYRTLG